MRPIHSIHRSISGVALTLLALLAFLSLPISRAQAQEGHARGTPAAGQYKSPAEAWKTAQEAATNISSLVAAKNLKPIHDEQAKLDAALSYIQANSAGAADKARLDGAIKNAMSASGKVHEASDAGDQAKVDSTVKTLQATMALVEKQLPAVAK